MSEFEKLVLEKLDALGTDVKEIRTDVNVLKDDVREIRADVNTLQDNVKKLQTDMIVLQNDVKELRSEQELLEELCTDFQAAKNTTKMQLDSHNDRLISLEKRPCYKIELIS